MSNSGREVVLVRHILTGFALGAPAQRGERGAVLIVDVPNDVAEPEALKQWRTAFGGLSDEYNAGRRKFGWSEVSPPKAPATPAAVSSEVSRHPKDALRAGVR